MFLDFLYKTLISELILYIIVPFSKIYDTHKILNNNKTLEYFCFKYTNRYTFVENKKPECILR